MKSLNKITLIGHVGKEPELKHTNTGKAVVSLSLATSEKYQDKETTTWHNIIAWEKLADIISQYVKKGSPLYVEGKITKRSYDDKDGNKRYVTEVVASNIIMLGSNGHSEKSDEWSKAVPAGTKEFKEETMTEDNSLPF